VSKCGCTPHAGPSRDGPVLAARAGGDAPLVGSTVVILGIASIFFLTAMLITLALMLRGRWGQMGQRPPPSDRHR